MTETTKGFHLRDEYDYYDLVNIENYNTQKANELIEDIESKIMSGTTPSNQLVNKNFVNSSIQTNTAFYRGSFTTWANVPTDPSQYRSDTQSSTTPTSNDYIVVEDASGYTVRTLEGTWRFKYTGTWANNGKNGWEPEYRVNEKPLTTAQQNALDSEVTHDKVSSYDAHINNKQNPHSVSKEQLGLGNVNNTSDLEKPVSNATQTELNKKVNIAQGSDNANKFLKTDTDGNVIADYLSADVQKIELVTALPASPNANTLYLIQESA